MIKIYKGWYGLTASVTKVCDGYKLKIQAGSKLTYNKILSSERACKQVMSRLSDGTMVEMA